jgi:hypothetical protein
MRERWLTTKEKQRYEESDPGQGGDFVEQRLGGYVCDALTEVAKLRQLCGLSLPEDE